MKWLAAILCLISCSTAAAIPNFPEYSKNGAREQAFFAYMRPEVYKANQQILDDRKRLLELYNKRFVQHKPLTEDEARWMKALYEKYHPFVASDKKQWDSLIRRVDIIPDSLTMAQAAKETDFGITRFAQQGNSLFGKWCYAKGCGLVPLRREPGQRFEVQSYPTTLASIEDYMLNLNTHPAYQELRDLRAQARANKQTPSGIDMAKGLMQYSQRKEIYINGLQTMIRQYQLEKNLKDQASSTDQ